MHPCMHQTRTRQQHTASFFFCKVTDAERQFTVLISIESVAMEVIPPIVCSIDFLFCRVTAWRGDLQYAV